MRRALALVIAAALLVPAGAMAQQPKPRASLGDIEDEVMCVVCGTTLNVSESPEADRERAFIRRLIARGETKKQIKDALVAEFGRSVLATPSGKGFDLAAYLVPAIALALAALAIGAAVLRWRRRSGKGEPLATGARGPTGAEDGARLRADLERYDL